MDTAEQSTEPRPAAPISGTVTFVFSDVEGSTRLLNSLREDYGQLLDDYYEIVGRAFERNGGAEIDRAGDGLFHSFPSARRAAAAAAEAQREMAEHAWPAGAVVRARMGLHTGEPISARTRYFGMDVHRAARIAAAGHGGQILLSQTTRDLVGNDLPQTASLTDLGQHWLKDLAEPEHLYQLSVEGLPRAFPPLRSLTTLPNNLPRNLSTFVGRLSDLAEVRQLIGEAALVTLTGPGGVGKTRLGLQLAAEMLETFTDGAWLVELEALTDESLVPQEVAIALGVARESDADANDALLGHIRGREMLLILDTCEHLIDACARWPTACCASAPACASLQRAARRWALRASGCTRSARFPCPKQPGSSLTELAERFEAVGLFAERAQGRRSRFRDH